MKDFTKGQLASRALSIWLGGFGAMECAQHIEAIRQTWIRLDGPTVDLEHCAPLVIVTAVLLEKTTGIRVLTEDTILRWSEECEDLIETESHRRFRSNA